MNAELIAVQAEGTCWPSGTTWRGRRCIRISVCNWQTTFDDVERSVEALVAAARHVALSGRQRSTGGPVARDASS